MDRFRGSRAGREGRREDAEQLGGIGDLIDVDEVRERLLQLPDDGDVGVVGEREELQAPPAAGHRGGRGGIDPGPAVVVGVGDGAAERIEARADGVVVKAREHDRVSRRADELDRATDPVVDLARRSGGGKACIGPVELDHEARSGLALQSQARGGMVIVNDDLVSEDVDDVVIVPDAVNRDLAATDNHAADRRRIAGRASLREIVVGRGVIDRVAHVLERRNREPGEGIDPGVEEAGEEFGAEGRLRPMGEGGARAAAPFERHGGRRGIERVAVLEQRVGPDVAHPRDQVEQVAHVGEAERVADLVGEDRHELTARGIGQVDADLALVREVRVAVGRRAEGRRPGVGEGIARSIAAGRAEKPRLDPDDDVVDEGAVGVTHRREVAGDHRLPAEGGGRHRIPDRLRHTSGEVEGDVEGPLLPVGGVVDLRRDPIVAEERPDVVVILDEAIDLAGAAAVIGHRPFRHRVGIDADRGAGVVAEVVADDHRLCSANEDGRIVVAAAGIAIGGRAARGIELDPAVGETQLTLLNFEGIEAIEASLDRRQATGIGDVGVVDARLRSGLDDDPTPVAGGADIGGVAIGVKRRPGAVPIVGQAREDHPLLRRPFGDELRVAALQFDPRSLELDHDPLIDLQAPRCPGLPAPGRLVEQIAAGAAGEDQILLDHIDDVGALEAGRHVELVDRAAERRADADKETVDRVAEEPVAADFGSISAVGVEEGSGIGRNRRPGAREDLVEGERRPGALDMDRRERLELRVDKHVAAAVLERRQADRVEEHLPGGGIGVAAENDATPLPPLHRRPNAVAVAAERIVVVGGELHPRCRRAEHLEGGPGPGNEPRGTADVDDGGAELERRPLVDHHRHPLRDVERRPVGKRRA